MKPIFLLMLMTGIIFSCKKNLITYNPHVVEAGGNKGQRLDTFQTERKIISGRQVTNVIISRIASSAYYKLCDANLDLISQGKIAIPYNTPAAIIKEKVFSLFGLTDLKLISFTRKIEDLYVAFNNIIFWNVDKYGICGRAGTSHTGNGRISLIPLDLITRQTGSRIRIPMAMDGTDVRGGASKVIRDTVYCYTSLYKTSLNDFTHIVLAKVNGFSGTIYSEDTILWKTGTHGGNLESTYKRFNVYPEIITREGGRIIYVPWYEHDGQGHWRTNYFYSEDYGKTHIVVNIPQGSSDKVGEFSLIINSDGRAIAIGRQDGNAPMRQNVCRDIKTHTWQQEYTPTNLGSGLGSCMPALENSPDHGVVCVYGDRGTSTIKISLKNDFNYVFSNATGYSDSKVIYTAGPDDPFKPLAYPSVKWVAHGHYMITFSIESNGKANVYTGYGHIDGM